MKFWVIPLVLAVAALGACRSDRVDVRDLTLKDRALFAKAAAIEGVDTTIHGRPGDWTVEYNHGLPFAAKSKQKDYLLNFYCKIRINPNKFLKCGGNNTDHYLMIVVRHELRHCDGQDHSSDSNRLMFRAPPCSPID